MRKKIKFSKNNIIIGGIILLFIFILFFVAKNTIKINKKDEVALTHDIYIVPEKEKVYIDGKVKPIKSEDLFIDINNKKIDGILVEDGQIIESGTSLFKYIDEKLILEIETLKKEIEKKEEDNNIESKITNIDNEEEKQDINEEIERLNNKVGNLKSLAYTTINAPFTGKVYLNNEKQNESKDLIMTIESQELEIEGQVSEIELSKICINQEVEVLVNSTKNKLKGKIIYIGERPSKEKSKKDMSYYDIKIGFLENQDLQNIKNGFHVKTTAEVINQQIKVPYTALLQEDEKRFVYKVIDGIVYKQEVKTGETNEKYAVITEGVGENDKVIKNADNKDIKEGEKIIINEKLESK